MEDKNSLVHNTWNCKYHIVFATKYRKQIIHIQVANLYLNARFPLLFLDRL